jgi:hypothetical protein
MWLLCQWGERGKRCSDKGEKEAKNKWIPGQTGIVLEEIESEKMGGVYENEADFSN